MSVEMLPVPAGHRIAVERRDGAGPVLVFCPGFLSDRNGGKALAVEAWAQARGQASVRFDYFGHGDSDGAAADGTIELWRDDVLALLHSITQDVVLVGSSMGGWLALLAAIARPQQVKALLLIAPAPDFTRWGIAEKFTPAQLAQLEQVGRVEIPSEYGPVPYIYTRTLVESGQRCAVLTQQMPLEIPVRILHGQNDPDVPWRLSLEIAEKCASENVEVHFIKDGDHRLSRPQDLRLLNNTLSALMESLNNSPSP